MRTHLLIIAAVAALPGCKKKRADKVETTEARPTEAPASTDPADGDLFLMAHPRVEDAPVPARFAAPLPSTVDALERPSSYPPDPMVSAALDRGDAAMQGKLLEAVRAAARGGEVPEELASHYTSLFGYYPSEAACTWARSIAAGSEPAGVRTYFFQVVARCKDPESGKALLAGGAPALAVIDWAFQFAIEGGTLAYDPKLVKAAEVVARDGKPDDVREIGFVLAAMGDRAIADAERMQKAADDDERRALIGLGLIESKSARAKKIGQASCRVLPDDAMCGGGGGDEPGDDPTKRPLDEQIAYGYEVDELLLRFPRADVVAGLRRCASRGDDDGFRCLRSLSSFDRATAAEVAAALKDPADPGDALVVRTLRAYPQQAALDAHLDQLGFRKATGTTPPSGPTVDDALAARDLATGFDTETGMFPNQHDELLADLAGLVTPALDGAIFEEVPPRTDDGPYLLRAYLDGKRYELGAENFGDWYDVGAVIGLLDAMLAARGRSERFLMLETGDQTASVIAGPAAGLRTLVDERLVQVAGASDAMDSGKAFEDKVFEQLEREGQDVQRDVIIR